MADMYGVSAEVAWAMVADLRAEWEANLRELHKAPEGSISHTLRTAYNERLAVLFRVMAAQTAPPDHLMQELEELRSYLLPLDPHPGAFEASLYWGGAGPGEVREILRRAEADERGKPALRRTDYVKACELQRQGATYREITAQLCTCGESEHDHGCQENIRRHMLRVKAVVERYTTPKKSVQQ